jgi:hypothetical protein
MTRGTSVAVAVLAVLLLAHLAVDSGQGEPAENTTPKERRP